MSASTRVAPSVADFNVDLKWSQDAHLFLARCFYPYHVYNGQFVYCDRTDKQKKGAMLIQKNLHIDTIAQASTPFNAVTIDEKIVRGYWKAFALETHSVTDSWRMPEYLGDGCILVSNADELLYGFPTKKACNCNSYDRQECNHQILAAELYIINMEALVPWFVNNYKRYPWRAIRNKAWWTHIRLVPINDIYRYLGSRNIRKILVNEGMAVSKTSYFEDLTGQMLLIPHENNLSVFKRTQ